MVGDIVWRGLYGILRIGTVVSSKKEDGWLYYQITWHADQPFEIAKKEGLTHARLKEEEASGWYRCDSVTAIPPNRLKQLFHELQEVS